MLLMSWHCCSGPSHLLQRSARNLGTDRATVQLWGWRKGEAAERKERAARVGLWRSPFLRRSLPRSSHRAAKAAAQKKHVRPGPSLRYAAPRIGSAKWTDISSTPGPPSCRPPPAMARTEALPAHQPDPTLISLTRLLDRLQRALLSPDADPKLRTSSFERTKVGAVGNLAVP